MSNKLTIIQSMNSFQTLIGNLSMIHCKIMIHVEKNFKLNARIWVLKQNNTTFLPSQGLVRGLTYWPMKFEYLWSKSRKEMKIKLLARSRWALGRFKNYLFAQIIRRQRLFVAPITNKHQKISRSKFIRETVPPGHALWTRSYENENFLPTPIWPFFIFWTYSVFWPNLNLES